MAHSHSIKEYPGQLAGIALLAAAAGAVSAVLFTPRRGTEVRNELRRRSFLMRNRLRRSQDTAKDAAEDTAEQMSDTMANAKRRATKGAKDAADEIRKNGE